MCYPLPKGFTIKINFGNKVKTEIIANSIAIPVKTPKWLIALVITITLVPKLNPWLEDYIESKFVADIGLGIFIYILALFVIINISKAISSTVTWSGLGAVDKTFGLIFGIFKGYVICVCIFALLNWFYPHEKWPIKTKDAYSFSIVFSGSKFLIKEFPNSEDYLDNTKNKIEDI